MKHIGGNLLYLITNSTTLEYIKRAKVTCEFCTSSQIVEITGYGSEHRGNNDLLDIHCEECGLSSVDTDDFRIIIKPMAENLK